MSKVKKPGVYGLTFKVEPDASLSSAGGAHSAVVAAHRKNTTMVFTIAISGHTFFDTINVGCN